jgi:mono/diheme cytochrome c family protein/cytochrome c553
MSTRTILIIVNLVAIAGVLGFIAYKVISLRRNPEEKSPDNLTPFYDDDVLEGAHLERVLGVSLIALVIAVIGLLGYFIWEPFREASAKDGFHGQSVERGAILFANSQSKEYDSTKSLLCANCHGVDGGGGVASFVVKSEDPRCDPNQVVNAELAEKQPYCLPKQVSWRAPSLQLAGLRFDRKQLTQIITYGRPGTPMPAWGVLSGKGALQEQSIQDLVNYVESIITTSDKAQAMAAAETPATRKDAQTSVKDHRKVLADAQTALAELPLSASDADKAAAFAAVTTAQANLDAAIDWNQQMQLATDGQILFQNNCARCHTRGWSYFDPNEPLSNPLPSEMGSGAYGPNLTNGDVDRQFPPPTGESELFSWISIGVEANQGYGIRGISSGRMPHFGAVLTKSQIEQIMAYERSL